MALSLGKIRGLSQIAGDDGVFAIVAMDQRSSLGALVGETPDPAWVRALKVDLAEAFSPHATAVLLDPEFGLHPAVARGAARGRCGLLVALEETGYEATPGGRRSRLLDGWGVAPSRRAGASAVKLLVYYNRGLPVAGAQRDLVAGVAAQARRHDIPLVLEAIAYDVAPDQHPAAVVASASDLVPLGVDLFKAQFPGVGGRADADAADWCRRLDEACGEVPWVVLSGGVPIDVFERQVQVACGEGASGFLAGRSVWKDAVAIADRAQRRLHLAAEGVGRFRRLAAIARAHARPWRTRRGAEPEAAAEWFRVYGRDA